MKQYFRDIWILGPPSTPYPGSFPNGLIDKLRIRWWGKKRLWVCSGGFHDPNGGVTLDMKREVDSTIVADGQLLPFKDATFDFVFADPPYSAEEAKRLYGVKNPNVHKIVAEMWRVVKPHGTIALMHRLVPTSKDGYENCPDPGFIVGIIGIACMPSWTNIRALTVWRKPGSIDPVFWNETDDESTAAIP